MIFGRDPGRKLWRGGVPWVMPLTLFLKNWISLSLSIMFRRDQATPGEER